MDERYLLNGVLFYASIYINSILLAVCTVTGRWIFLLFLLLTTGLTAYMMYIASHHVDHLKSVGKWAETTITETLGKVYKMIKGG